MTTGNTSSKRKVKKKNKSKPPEKPESKRSKSKLAHLQPELNLKTRYEEIIDLKQYCDKIPEKDQEWLNKFAKEYIGASLDSVNLKNNLHNTKKLKKDCYDRNNSRNRCIYTKAKAGGYINYIEDLSEDQIVNEDIEDELINKIDRDSLKDAFKKK